MILDFFENYLDIKYVLYAGEDMKMSVSDKVLNVDVEANNCMFLKVTGKGFTNS